MLPALAEALTEPVVLVDIGCRWGFADTWAQLGPHAVIVGFDPDPDECERLRAHYTNSDADIRLHPLGLGATTGPATLHVARHPACSSLYPPDPAAVARHPSLAIIQTDRVDKIELVTLDDWAEIEHIQPDAIKLDTQGSELDILRGAEHTLPGVRMLEVEVEFNPIYAGQPLFADIDRHLRDRGFELWRLAHLTHYALGDIGIDSRVEDRQDYVAGIADPDQQHTTPIFARGGQLYFADAYYVNRAVLARRDDEQESLRDACVAAAFGFGDLAAHALGDNERR